MRIFLHDYPGHAFPVDLARELARRGHVVGHAWSPRFQTPKGALAPRPDDAPTLSWYPIELGEAFAKHSYARRMAQERRYARLVAAEAARFAPDAIIANNAPLEVQHALLRAARARGARFVFWMQDIYSVAIALILGRRLPPLGWAAGLWFGRLERQLLERADAIVMIADDFRAECRKTFGTDGGARTVTIENWAPVGEVRPAPRDNGWARAHDLVGRRTVLYSGTLGHKHNPDGLVALARALGPEARMVVVSEGPVADELAARAAADPALAGLTILPWQPPDRLSEVLGAADLAVATIEPEAGRFSVPSKVLSYLAAGRPILLAVPPDNLAARIVTGAGAGRVVPPGDVAGFVAAAEALLADAPARAAMASAARAYAERTFPIAGIADRFEALLAGPPRTV